MSSPRDPAPLPGQPAAQPAAQASDHASEDALDRAGRDSNGFARVVNLSDAIFAIAMTLLVLTVDVPDVPDGDLAAALRRDLPQLGAYALAFALVASQWYAHRKLFERLAFIEPGLTVINLVLLGVVALVPFPTSVLGSYPTATAAVVPFLAVFVALTAGYVAMIMRSQAVDAWTEPLPTAFYRRVVRAFTSGALVLLAGVAISFWFPLFAIGMALVSSVPTIAILRGVPMRYRHWF
jgi:uncharacterized membrane protein